MVAFMVLIGRKLLSADYNNEFLQGKGILAIGGILRFQLRAERLLIGMAIFWRSPRQ